MTVKDLIKRLAAYPDHFEIMLSRDSEGNGYSSLEEMGLSLFDEDDEIHDADEEFEDDEERPKLTTKLTFWP